MGMFDAVIVRCPACNEAIEFQSKAGPCRLNDYSIEAVPVDIAIDLSGEAQECDCGVTLKIFAPVAPEVSMNVVAVAGGIPLIGTIDSETLTLAQKIAESLPESNDEEAIARWAERLAKDICR